MHKALEHLIGPKYIHFSCGEAVTNAAVNELREGEKKKKELGQIETVRVTREECCCVQYLFILGDGSSHNMLDLFL